MAQIFAQEGSDGAIDAKITVKYPPQSEYRTSMAKQKRAIEVAEEAGLRRSSFKEKTTISCGHGARQARGPCEGRRETTISRTWQGPVHALADSYPRADEPTPAATPLTEVMRIVGESGVGWGHDERGAHLPSTESPST